MKRSKLPKRITDAFDRLKSTLKPLQSQMLSFSKSKMQVENPYTMAFHAIGNRTDRFLPLFKDLESNLKKGALKTSFRAYVSLTVFVTFVLSIANLALTPCLLIFIFGIPPWPAVLFGIGASLFTIAFSTIGFYIYPIYRSDNLKRRIEDELPFATAYMTILTSAGVSPERIFHSLSSLSVPLAASIEAKDIVRDVNLFGLDIISALQQTSKRTSSQRFREMIEGFISTVHSGGNLAAYLREKTKQYMKLKRIGLKKYSDTLSILSEFYVALLLTGPLLLIIMLSVMSMLGGGDLGILNPDLLMKLLTYICIPIGAIAFLIILDTLSPKW